MRTEISRFACSSSALELRSLLSKTRRGLLVAVSVATGAHLSLTAVRGFEAQEKVAKPLTTQFVKRQPRLAKPLEMKKTPRPKRRRIERTMVAVKARVDRGGPAVSARPTMLFGNLARPAVGVARAAFGQEAGMEPHVVAQHIAGTRQPDSVVDLGLEMIEVQDLDTGRYQAMVVQDPRDKRSIKGYARLAIAFPLSVYHRFGPEYNSVDSVVTGIRRLVERLNQWTELEASVTKRISFDSAEFFETPWTYLFLNFGFEPTQSEIENLGKYLLTGGFFFFEGNYAGGWNGERYLFEFVADGLGSQGYRRGVDWEFESIPNGHPIFHCYYDFPEGVPMGGTLVAKYLWNSFGDDGMDPRSKGVSIGGRLLAFNTNQNMLNPWLSWGTSDAGGAYSKYDPTTQFRFGINTIIFALTQEGSITRRVMNAVQ